MFPIRRGAPYDGIPLQPRPQDAWRAAARLVWTRWEAFLESPREGRSRAFASYLAALDAEAAAAADIADLATVRA
jgi:hypothetical protein